MRYSRPVKQPCDDRRPSLRRDRWSSRLLTVAPHARRVPRDTSFTNRADRRGRRRRSQRSAPSAEIDTDADAEERRCVLRQTSRRAIRDRRHLRCGCSHRRQRRTRSDVVSSDVGAYRAARRRAHRPSLRRGARHRRTPPRQLRCHCLRWPRLAAAICEERGRARCPSLLVRSCSLSSFAPRAVEHARRRTPGRRRRSSRRPCRPALFRCRARSSISSSVRTFGKSRLLNWMTSGIVTHRATEPHLLEVRAEVEKRQRRCSRSPRAASPRRTRRASAPCRTRRRVEACTTCPGTVNTFTRRLIPPRFCRLQSGSF